MEAMDTCDPVKRIDGHNEPCVPSKLPPPPGRREGGVGIGKLSPVPKRQSNKKRWTIVLGLTLLVVVVALAILLPVLLLHKKHGTTPRIDLPSDWPNDKLEPLSEIQIKASDLVKACNRTRFYEVCMHSLAGLNSTRPTDIISSAIQAAIHGVSRTKETVESLLLNSTDTESPDESSMSGAKEDCLETLSDSLDQLNDTLTELKHLSVRKIRSQFENLKTWSSSALTMHSTCMDSMEEENTTESRSVLELGNHTTKLLSNSLALLDLAKSVMVLIKPPRILSRRLLSESKLPSFRLQATSIVAYPDWLPIADRQLLETRFNPVLHRKLNAEPNREQDTSKIVVRSALADPFAQIASSELPDGSSPGEGGDVSSEYPDGFPPGEQMEVSSELPQGSSPIEQMEVSSELPDAPPGDLIETATEYGQNVRSHEGNYNAVVALDGSGDHTSIQAAVDAAPVKSETRYVIFIKAGAYYETVIVSRSARYLMFVGEGISKTVISGNKSVTGSGVTTFKTATVTIQGKGFIAQDLTIENTAGPENHQAVALRVSADLAAFLRCSFEGYQDTLYVHTLRQFYKDCTITGTIDFIFGNSAAVFQGCTILARKPMESQLNTYTAQGKTDPNQNTGLSFQQCTFDGTPDLQSTFQRFPTYLGRPWKTYATTVILQSTIGSVVHPDGWIPWDGENFDQTCYYAEYMNSGPGAGVLHRVTWSQQITDVHTAAKYTPDSFISAPQWLPQTNIQYIVSL